MQKFRFIRNSIYKLCLILFAVAAAGNAVSVAAQSEETEPVRSSILSGIELPENAQRVLPQSVPAEVDDTLNKVVAQGNGKLERGETEVIV